MRIRLELIELSNPETGGDGGDRNRSLVGTQTSTRIQAHGYVDGTLTCKCRRLGLKARELSGPSRSDLGVIVSG